MALRKIIFGAMVLLLTGCGHFQSFSPVTSAVPVATFPLLTEEERARIHDISFPLGVEPAKLSFTEKQLVLSFQTELSQDKLNEHYRKGMEYWGWERLGAVQAAESCMVFSKPSKICTITFRDEGSATRVLVFSTARTRR